RLSEGGEPVACGWIKDRYGLSWQIVPSIMLKFLADPDREKAARVMKTMMDMVKLDIAALQAAYDGRA
ncbi:MAG: VOC family protein, partial [Rhizobiales bacterium]|nr:VOC family protein [Hyphomicrobiales bacterium]